MIYEVINPSDEVTIESEDELVACVAILTLGNGKLGLTRADGGRSLPLFIFGGAEEWLAEKGIPVPGGFRDYLTARALDIAAVLESAMCCSAGTRAAVLAAVGDDPAKRVEALARFNDTKRSSLNNICGAAHELAAAYRARHAEAA
jgi:hypothetical protein